MRHIHLTFTLLLLVLCAVPVAASTTDLVNKANEYIEPIPYGAPEVEGNLLTAERVELGKMLFFEPRLSRSSLISCNTCHNVGLGGADYQETSTGHGWQKGPRNAPTVLNAVFNLAQFWDGRAEDLAAQAMGPVQAAVEMNNTPERVEETLKSMPEYVDRFTRAFPTEKNPLTFKNMAVAIEAFEATLVTPNAPLDRFLRGDVTALSKKEQDGLEIFIDKGCVACHGGVNLGGTDYYPFGVVEQPDASVMAGDRGRFKVTNSEADNYVFKSPSLRNIELTAPYFHSGKVWGLEDAVAIMSSAQLGATLSSKEIDRITAFLKATTGEQPRVVHPVLPAPTEDTLKPEL